MRIVHLNRLARAGARNLVKERLKFVLATRLVILLHLVEVLLRGQQSLLLYHHQRLHVVEVTLLIDHVLRHQLLDPIHFARWIHLIIGKEMADVLSKLLLLSLQPVLHFDCAHVQFHFDVHFHSIDLFVEDDSHRVDTAAFLQRSLMFALALLVFLKLLVVVLVPPLDIFRYLYQLFVEECVLLLLALVHFHHLRLPLLQLLDGEDVEDFVALLDFGTSHLFHTVLFDLARDFLDEVLGLDFE